MSGRGKGGKGLGKGGAKRHRKVLRDNIQGKHTLRTFLVSALDAMTACFWLCLNAILGTFQAFDACFLRADATLEV